jgi:transcriptional regulator with XRE-family HTH domain
MSIVSENIKYLRRVNGLTQEQFSRRVGIKRSLLGAYEEGRANPNLENLTNIAKIFGTSLDNLIKNDIRNLRETQSVPLPQPSPQLLAPLDEPIKEVKKTQVTSIIEKYYQDESAKQGNHLESKPAAEHPPVAKPGIDKPAQTIEVVRLTQVADYMHSHASHDYLQKLPVFQLPSLPAGHFRAFEVGDDFAFPGALVVGKLVNDWYNLIDGKHYVVLHHQKGVLYRRVYGQVKIKGIFLLSSDKATIASIEIPVREVLEIWEVQAFVSTQLPEPAISLDRITQLAADLQQELNRLTMNSKQ